MRGPDPHRGGADRAAAADDRWSGCASGWRSNREALVRTSQVLRTVSGMTEPDLAPLSVALRTLRGLVRQPARPAPDRRVAVAPTSPRGCLARDAPGECACYARPVGTLTDVDWLHRLVGDWQMLADLSFADLTLWLPVQLDDAADPHLSPWFLAAHAGPPPGRTSTTTTSSGQAPARRASACSPRSWDRQAG